MYQVEIYFLIETKTDGVDCNLEQQTNCDLHQTSTVKDCLEQT